MRVLYGAHEAFSEHEAGVGHPESPDRLAAIRRGIALAGLDQALFEFGPRRASSAELGRVHDRDYLNRLEELCLSGGGRIDPDTSAVEASLDAALRAAGSGPDAIARLRSGEADAAFLAVRPPGHHARPSQGMGFCLLNNAAVAAADLLDSGERVLVVDIDAHHGNGTQEAFYAEDRLLYVSLHQSPLYPGSGALTETGEGQADGCTINIPFPAGTRGDAYRVALDEVIVPAAEGFAPTWLVVSAGFDAHRADPLTDLGLSAGDFGDLAERLVRLAPPGRRLFFLEGGYDLEALALSSASLIAALTGARFRPEPVTGGDERPEGPTEVGTTVARAAGQLHEHLVRARR
jgi:acetoin utilization deacetylase AcuC-like enzyme